MKMDQQRLNEIKERYHAASDGPWIAEGPGTDVYDSVASSAPSGLKVAYDVLADGDAIFIAHARTDIPDMYAEIIRLTGQLRKARKQRDEWKDKAQDAMDCAMMGANLLSKTPTVTYCLNDVLVTENFFNSIINKELTNRTKGGIG